MAKATVLHDPAILEEPRSAGDRFVDWRPVGAGGAARLHRLFCFAACLSRAPQDDRRYIESLRREVLISRRLRHTNICPIHDLYEGERGVGIVMDLIEGHDLKQWLKEQRGRLLDTMPKRLALFTTLCSTLTVAHSLIIHRDLKPGNIFL